MGITKCSALDKGRKVMNIIADNGCVHTLVGNSGGIPCCIRGFENSSCRTDVHRKEVSCKGEDDV